MVQFLNLEGLRKLWAMIKSADDQVAEIANATQAYAETIEDKLDNYFIANPTNIWDYDNWEDGDVDITTGEDTTGTAGARMKSDRMITIQPDTLYQLSVSNNTYATQLHVLFYAANNDFVDSVSLTLQDMSSANISFTTPQTAFYYRAYVETTANVFWNKISFKAQLESGSIATTYQEPIMLNTNYIKDKSIPHSKLEGEIFPTIHAEGYWEYRIFPDGTFEGWYKKVGETFAINTASGTLYRSNLTTIDLPLGITDYYTPTIRHLEINVGHNNYPSWGMIASLKTSGASEVGFNYYALSGGSRNTNPNYLVTAYVFGTYPTS